MAPTVVKASLNYVKPPEESEEWLQHYIPGSVGIHRLKIDPHHVEITDIRSTEEPCLLDVQGFQIIKGKPVDRRIFDQDNTDIASRMAAQAVELLKETTGASYVLMFNHVTRFEPPEKLNGLSPDMPNEAMFPYMGPFASVHVDQSYRGGRYIVNNFKHIPEVAQRLTESGTTCRFAVINVWQPVSPVTRDALALCDRRTVDEQDLRPWRSHPDPSQWDPKLPLPLSEIWRPMYNPKHKWYYASKMQTNEALLIKCFDTKLDEHSRAVPHSAFRAPSDSGPPRESVEFRCLVFWDSQPFSDETAFLNPVRV
ncbi:hypothetical protein CB0940_12147 [Cercospora beticola]|uniref:Uncharacterized protein n=1 Tax=Cercospora beticola TaxID=122368 RepID=A0A2G5GIB2_CERBT|nr:hypothetical protein CB0940_12147 [Cercospora beticola]PIA80016.1 hypothetical protein CB0940_12147 [Cercospora beticola]WPB07647.1 hypothetical protein RHO25_012308 [Cercospora beticola]CAK1356549.1 unnamed protein product [Cercospora beticola]